VPAHPLDDAGTGVTGAVRSGTGAVAEVFWEDLVPGRRFDLGVAEIDRDEMLAFARRFDPQWYHVDEPLATGSEYGGLIASGFFTMGLFMRAYVDGLLSRAAAAASPGLEELRWLAPVYAGDRLAVTLEVLDRAPSRAKPGCGTVTLQGTMTRLSSPPRDVLRTRFRGWFLRREPDPEAGAPARHPDRGS
jgi:acyl dehydratase